MANVFPFGNGGSDDSTGGCRAINNFLAAGVGSGVYGDSRGLGGGYVGSFGGSRLPAARLQLLFGKVATPVDRRRRLWQVVALPATNKRWWLALYCVESMAAGPLSSSVREGGCNSDDSERQRLLRAAPVSVRLAFGSPSAASRLRQPS